MQGTGVRLAALNTSLARKNIKHRRPFVRSLARSPAIPFRLLICSRSCATHNTAYIHSFPFVGDSTATTIKLCEVPQTTTCGARARRKSIKLLHFTRIEMWCGWFVRCAQFVHLPPFISLPTSTLSLLLVGLLLPFLLEFVIVSIVGSIDAKHFRQPNCLLISLLHVENSETSIDKFYGIHHNCVGAYFCKQTRLMCCASFDKHTHWSDVTTTAVDGRNGVAVVHAQCMV